MMKVEADLKTKLSRERTKWIAAVKDGEKKQDTIWKMEKTKLILVRNHKVDISNVHREELARILEEQEEERMREAREEEK